jgi:hypothetical protein
MSQTITKSRARIFFAKYPGNIGFFFIPEGQKGEGKKLEKSGLLVVTLAKPKKP